MKTAKRFFGCLMMVMVAVSQSMPSPIFAEEKTIPALNVTMEGIGEVKVTENETEHIVTSETSLSLRLQENTEVLFDIHSTNDIVALTNNGEVMAEFVEGKKEMQFTYTVQSDDQTIHIVFDGETTSGLSPPEETEVERDVPSTKTDTKDKSKEMDEDFGKIDVDVLKEYNKSIDVNQKSTKKRSVRSSGNTFNDITGANIDGDALASKAREWVGRLRYVNGSKHPNSGSIDCSGFVTWIVREYLGTMWIGNTQGGWSYNPEHFVGDRSSYYTANSGPGMYTMGSWDSYTGHLYLDNYGIGSPNLMDVRAWDTLLRNGKAVTSLSRGVSASSLTMCGNAPREGFDSFNPGDIVIFYLDTGGNDTGATSGLDPHMGIYSGNGNFIHSSMATGGVAESPITSIYQGSSAASVKSYRIFRVSESSGSLQITKSSSNPDLTNGNANYGSFAGAEYGLYSDENATNQIGTFTIGNNGKSNVIEGLKEGTYYVKETKAPKNYALDSKIHSVQVVSGELKSFDFKDKPQSDPVGILLKKRDAETGKETAQGDGSLADAEFTVKYYDGFYDNASQLNGKKPKRSWVLKTDKDGFTSLDRNYKISGDDFYYMSNGEPTLPLGTITIQETKAPKGYKLNNELFIRKITAEGTSESVNTYNEPIIQEQIIKGKIRVAKKDRETGKVVKVAGTQFDIYHENTKVDSITTDDTGYATSKSLPYGRYTVKEAHAPNGYVVDVNQSQTIDVHAEHTYNTELSNKRVTVTLKLVKEDSETGSRPQGDATLTGAVYGLYAKENILDPSGDGTVIYMKDELVGQITTDENARGQLENLYLGEYYWKEIRPSVGYELDTTKYSVTPKYKDENTTTITVNQIGKEVIRTGEFDIVKVITDGAHSEIVTNEKGAEFVAVLKEDYEANGKDIQKALTYAKENRTDKEYSVLTTNDNGYAKSRPLAYGKYVIQQTKRGENAEETDLLEGIFTFEVAEVDGRTIVKGADTNGNALQIGEDGKMHYHINNRPSTYYVRLMKQDKDTGRIVTFNSAKFKIKDSYGNYVTQTVAGRVYDTFVTNSDNGQIGILARLFGSEWQSDDDDKGSVIVPLELKAGTYTLEEVETPKGFLALEQPIEFVVERKAMTESTPSGDPVLTVVAKNDQPTGTLQVHKTVEDFKSDTTFIDRDDLSGIQFSLYANEDIIDMIDGSILYKKGELFGSYSLSKDGHLTVEDIPMGSYILKETQVPDGFVLDTQEYDVVFKQEDLTTKIYTVTHNIKNKTTKYEFSKKAVTGDDEIEGARMQVKDSHGTVVDEWVSSGPTHVIEGLTTGETYTLVEDYAPNGYVRSSSIEFTVPNTGDIQHVEMIDTIERVAKVDQDGNYVEGARMQVLSPKTKNILDEWVTNAQIVELTKEQQTALKKTGNLSLDKDNASYTFSANQETKDYTLQVKESDGIVSYYDVDITGKETTHRISNLEAGHDYILREVKAPKDYARAVDEMIAVEDNQQDGLTTMINKQVTFTKEDVGGQEIAGASMKVVDSEGEVVDEWISTNEKHSIQNLEVGQTYTFIEENAPNGYVLAAKIEFTVTDDGLNQHETMIDTIERIAKVDEKGNYVAGAQLQVVSPKTKNVVDEWISGQRIVRLTKEQQSALNKAGKLSFTKDDKDYHFVKNENRSDYTLQVVEDDGTISYYDVNKKGYETTHRISGLISGQEYILREAKAPKDYARAVDAAFKVEDNQKDASVTMIDKKVSFSKIDVGGKEIEGAAMKVVDSEGETVDEWVSTDEIHFIQNLEVDQTYTLIEESAPIGYVLASPVQFTVTDDGLNQHETMIDTIERVAKVDEKGNFVEGAQLQVLSPKTKNILDEWKSNSQIVQLSDEQQETLREKGKVSFEREGISYDLTANKATRDFTLQIVDAKGFVYYFDVDETGRETTHRISNLEVGQDYILREVKAPEDYARAVDETIAVEDNQQDGLTTMINKQVIFTKEDVGGQEIAGASMKVVDSKGEVVDEWISTNEKHSIQNLEVSQTYTLIEEVAPNGYVKANNITFTVTDDDKNQHQTMIDTVQRVEKVDQDGNSVDGAKLEVISARTKNVIDQWISGQQIVKLTEEQSKELVEQKELSFEKEGIQYVLSANIVKETLLDELTDGQVKDYTLQVTEKDGTISYYDVDETGKETTHRVSGLEVSKDYILREVKAPKDYARAVDVKFTVKDNQEDAIASMVNKQVTFTKEDVGGQEIAGASMKVVDSEGEVVDEWISTNEKHSIQNLEVGQSYTLIEESAPNGYVLATKIEFTVTDDGLNQHETMIDTIERIAKVDEKGNYVSGAKLQVISEKSKQIVDEWITGEQIVELTEEQTKTLEANKELSFTLDEIQYILKENAVPPIEDSVEPETANETQEDAMIEEEDSKEAIKDYTLQVIDKDGIVSYYDVDSTGRETTHRISNLEQGHSYVVQEVETPKGYRHADDIFLENVGQEDCRIDMIDQTIKTELRIHKVDSETNEAIQSGDFEFTLYADKDLKEKILTVKGEKETGIARIKQIPVGVWYIKETKAPTGYDLSDEVVKYEVKDTGEVYVNDKEISEDKGGQWAYSIVYKNEKTPKTNTGVAVDNTFRNFMMGLLVVSFGMIVWILRKMSYAQIKK